MFNRVGGWGGRGGGGLYVCVCLWGGEFACGMYMYEELLADNLIAAFIT